MIRRKIGSMIASCGIVMLMFGLSALPAQGAEPSSVALQPSPRPAIDPLKHHNGSGVEMGHITGTVIDQRTGAPAAGVIVRVGLDLIVTDANGNYDHWLPVGDYPVALQLDANQGAADQGEVMVAVQPAVPTIQHLNFHSPAPAAAPAVAVPAAPAALPTAVIAITAAKPAPKPAAAPSGTPKRLPRTGAEDNTAWMWLGFGMLLLLMGGLVGFGPVINGRSAAAVLRKHAANAQLLQALLSQPARDEFLAALFDNHDRRHR
jgi:LPXTG-motif cell wall-anchored protein